jgi:hypothetical protein
MRVNPIEGKGPAWNWKRGTQQDGCKFQRNKPDPSAPRACVCVTRTIGPGKELTKRGLTSLMKRISTLNNGGQVVQQTDPMSPQSRESMHSTGGQASVKPELFQSG